MNNIAKSALLVDAHVHIYNCFEIDALLTAAARNFKHAARELGIKEGYTGILLLAETSRDNWFLRTSEECVQNQQSSATSKHNYWRINKTRDNAVLQAKQHNAAAANMECIYIMAGRQIITAEGLELLALATDGLFEDGLSVASALDAVREQDAIPVMPWAAGKWLGGRGKLLSNLLKAEAHSDLCLGDNGGRPIFWRNPLHFRQAASSSMHILPGTDPLPFAREVGRIGGFGFMIHGALSSEAPSACLKQLLRNTELQMTVYGHLETPLRFFVNQIRLRVS